MSLSNLGSMLKSVAGRAGSWLSGIIPGATPSPSPIQSLYNRPSHGKASGDELGYGSFRPQIYREPAMGESHYVPHGTNDIAAADLPDISSKVARYLNKSGHNIDSGKVMEILGKLKIPALGMLGVAAVAGLVLGAMKLYQKFKPKEVESQSGNGMRRRRHGAGVISA